MNSAKDTVQF